MVLSIRKVYQHLGEAAKAWASKEAQTPPPTAQPHEDCRVIASSNARSRATSASSLPTPPTASLATLHYSKPAVPSKGVLPLGAHCKVSPGQSLVIRSRSQVEGLQANRLLVADPQKWKISSLRAGPRIGGCQVRGDHPALLDPNPGSSAKLPLLTMDRDVTLKVEYVGPETYGLFKACLCLENDQQERDLRTTSDQPKNRDPAALSFLAKSPPIVRGEQICLPMPMRAHDLHITDLILRVTEPAHWLVSDILIGGDTLLVDDGDLPGELLADRPGRVPLRLGRLRAKEELIIQATYIGPLVSAAAASLSFEVFGSEVPANKASANFAFLPMSSRVTISGLVQVQAQIGVPTGYAFLPGEIVLRDSEKWIVSDVRNGNRSQFAASGSIPGTLFGGRARECQPNFDAVPGDNTFLLIADYVGSNPEGETLVCGVVGRVVRLPPTVGAGTSSPRLR